MIEGSGSGSIPLTTGSGSGRPKNIWIRWIRIRNTALQSPAQEWSACALSKHTSTSHTLGLPAAACTHWLTECMHLCILAWDGQKEVNSWIHLLRYFSWMILVGEEGIFTLTQILLLPPPSPREAVFRIRIRIRLRIHRILMFLGHKDPDPDPLVRGMDPAPDPSIINQK